MKQSGRYSHSTDEKADGYARMYMASWLMRKQTNVRGEMDFRKDICIRSSL